MSRSAIPFAVDDISTLAKTLEKELAAAADPGHVQLLNMLARAAGYKNFQHMRAAAEAAGRLETPPPPPTPIDFATVERISRYFDFKGILIRWPGKASHREPCLWALWARIAPHRIYGEKEINAILTASHAFADYALLRREMFDRGMLWRTLDGRQYRRIEGKPPAMAEALIHALQKRLEVSS
jgi:hypothetical protein